MNLNCYMHFPGECPTKIVGHISHTGWQLVKLNLGIALQWTYFPRNNTISLQDQQFVPSPIAPSCKFNSPYNSNNVRQHKKISTKWLKPIECVPATQIKAIVLTSKYVLVYQRHDPSRFYVPIPMLPVKNRTEAGRSKSYQQAPYARSTPPRMYQLPS